MGNSEVFKDAILKLLFSEMDFNFREIVLRNDIEPTFYYHSDHLGSASYSGAVTQTLNHLPHGEDWVDLQNFNVMPAESNLGVYKFNGKEKDSESGYNYYE
jgi:hypothetical protein